MKQPLDAIRWRVRAWLALLSARRQTRAALVRPGIARILVVCYGNIYRSAFAGEYLKRRLGSGVDVRSRGFHLPVGRPAPARHVDMSRERGVNLTSHASSLLVMDDLSWADVVVLMDRQNWVRLCRMGADPQKLAWLGACAPGPVEIADPYAMDDDVAARLLDRLLLGCEGLVEILTTARAR